MSAPIRGAPGTCVPTLLRLLMVCGWGMWCGCGEGPPPAPRVEVGVFFGGQVQQLQRVEVDRARPPNIGFRVHLPEGRRAATQLSYEVVALGPAGRRVTRQEYVAIPAHHKQVDQVVAVPPDARLGLWNIRVSDEHQVLADRAVFLVEADAHKRGR